MNPISKPKPVEGGETMNIKTEKWNGSVSQAIYKKYCN